MGWKKVLVLTFLPAVQNAWEEDIKLHIDFKKENGYSELEIANKRQAIENVLITETKEQHLNRLRDCGFVETSCFFQCLNFVSFLSVK